MTAHVSFLRPGRRTAVAHGGFMAAYALAVGVYSSSAAAQTCDVNPSNPFGTRITISGYTYTDADYVNAGEITVSGTFENNGYKLTNCDYGNYGSLIGVYGKLYNNQGDLYNYGRIWLSPNIGELKNTGRLENLTDAAVIYNYNSANNDGLLFNTGYIFNYSSGVLTNNGTLENSNYIFNYKEELKSGSGSFFQLGVLNNVGTLVQNQSGAIFNESKFINNGYIRLGGLIENKHELINETTGTVNATTGVIENQNLLINKGLVYLQAGNPFGPFPQPGGGLSNSSSGTLINEGRIVIDDERTISDPMLKPLTAAFMENSGYMKNSTGAEVQVFGYLENSTGAVLENNGVITNDGKITNYGTLTVEVGGVLDGTGTYSQYDPAAVTRIKGRMEQGLVEIYAGQIGGKDRHKFDNFYFADGVKWDPGLSPGTMTIEGNGISGADILFEVAGLAPEEYDSIVIDGMLSFISGSLITIAFIDGFLPEDGNIFEFLLVSGGVSGWDNVSLMVTGLRDGFEYAIHRENRGLFFEITEVPGTGSVPEPGSYALVLAGLGLMGFMSRRRRAMAV